MASDYTTIDGQHGVCSSWPCPYTSNLHETAGEYRQSYTRVVLDIPEAADEALERVADYWVPYNQYFTDFALANRFGAQMRFLEDSLEVFFNGEVLPETDYEVLDETVNVSGEPYVEGQVIRIDTISGTPVDEADDGHLWIAYIPEDVDNAVGDRATAMESSARVVATTIRGNVETRHVIRARQVTNGIETFLGMAATLWIGGPDNSVRSVSDNLIPGVSPIYREHLIQLQEAITLIEYRLLELTSGAYSYRDFLSIGDNDPYMLKFIEEIYVRLNEIEQFIIDNGITHAV